MKGICGKHMSFQKRMDKMVEVNAIDLHLHKGLCQLWDFRNREHLFLLAEWEYGKYDLTHYNSAVKVLRALRESLDKYFRNMETPF